MEQRNGREAGPAGVALRDGEPGWDWRGVGESEQWAGVWEGREREHAERGRCREGGRQARRA